MPQLPDVLLCRKVGMTRLFTKDGTSIPSSILDMSCNFDWRSTSQHPDPAKATPDASTTRRLREMGSRLSIQIRKPQLCSLIKINHQPPDLIRSQLDVLSDVFMIGQKVKVRSKSIGKGFAGAIKRHNFKSGKASHGNSKAHNKPGSTGMTQDPGRVFRGKRMPGHLGNKNVSVRNLEIVFIADALNFLALRGSIPGHIGSPVLLLNQTAKPRRQQR